MILPGRNVHSIVGAGVGLASSLSKVKDGENSSDYPQHRKTGVILSIGLVSGMLGAILPDFLEPAYSYKHRKFFHSVVLSVLMVFGILCFRQKRITKVRRVFIESFLEGYLSHIVLDSITPMRIPFI